MKNNEQTARLSIKLPPTLLKMVQEKSEKTGISLSWKIRKSLEAWLNDSITFYFSSKEDREKAKPIIDKQIGNIINSTDIDGSDKFIYEIGLIDGVTTIRIEVVAKMLSTAYQIHNVEWEVPYDSES